MDQVKVWWDNASSRDQLFIAILAGVFAVFGLFMFVLQPVVDMRNEQERKLVQQQALFERVKKLSAELISRTESKASQSGNSGNLEQVVGTSFAEHDLRVSRFDASGRGGIRVQFTNVVYEKFVAWLHDLEMNKGMVMKDIKVAAAKDKGRITANILIQR